MKERPILFSAPMVRALLDGSKTQTRRVVKRQPENGWAFDGSYGRITSTHSKKGRFGAFLRRGLSTDFPQADIEVCPYGQPGDRLRVRETFLAYGQWETRFSAKKARDEWHFVDMTVECDRRYQYAAGRPDVPLAAGRGGARPGWYMRPAIFMPRAASRILLEIVSVRVERLNDISDVDAVAEGIGLTKAAIGMQMTFPAGESMCVNGYRQLWELINGAGNWAANPWVWCVEFKRVTP